MEKKFETVFDELIVDINSKNETIIFCGAGISRNSGILTVDDFYKELQKILEIGDDILEKIVSDTPFESIIEMLLAHEIKLYLFESLYNRYTPNTNHFFIAELLSANRVDTILTTNFDLLIEEALKIVSIKNYENLTLLSNPSTFYKVQIFNNKQVLVKLHGSVDNLNQMAITINSVAQKSNIERLSPILKEVFDNGKENIVIILGYSGSDKFDINPILSEIKNSSTKVYFVKHIKPGETEGILTFDEKNPFYKFNGYQINVNTDFLIKKLWENLIKMDYIEIFKKEEHWKEGFARWKDRLRTFKGFKEYEMIANLLSTKDELPLTLKFIDLAIEKVKKMGNPYGISVLTNRKVSLLLNTNTSNEELEQMLEYALSLNPKELNLANYCDIRGHQGIIKNRLLEYDEAMVIFEEILSISKSPNQRIVTYQNIALIHRKRFNFAEAIKNLKIAQKLAETNLPNHLGELYFAQAIVYEEAKDFPKAKELFIEAINFAREVGHIPNKNKYESALNLLEVELNKSSNA